MLVKFQNYTRSIMTDLKKCVIFISSFEINGINHRKEIIMFALSFIKNINSETSIVLPEMKGQGSGFLCEYGISRYRYRCSRC